MTRFFGLRGNSLNLVSLFGITMPATMSFAYNQVLLGGILTLQSFEKQFPEIDVVNAVPSAKKSKSIIQGTVVALFSVGGLFGALSCIGWGDILGRRRVIIIASGLQLLGAILSTSAYSLAHLIVSRIFLGLGVGGLMATAPVWQSEISSTSKRGAHLATIGIFGGLGAGLALLLELAVSFAPGSIGWRFPCAFQALLPMTVIGFISFLPESPRWLIKVNQIEKAREILALLEAVEVTHPQIEAEIQAVQFSLKSAGEGSLRVLFRMGQQRTFHRAMLAVVVMAFLQLTGINVIGPYTNTIFETYLDLNSVVSRVLAVGYQIVAIVSGILCTSTVEKFGRRKLMMIGAAGNAICMTVVAALGSRPDNQAAVYGAIVFIFLYHFTFIFGFAGVPFLYATEIAPLAMRGAISGISLSTFWALFFLITESTPLAFEAIGWRYFLVFAIMNVVIIGVVYLLFPETSGRTLEEIDQIFVSSNNIWESSPHIVARARSARQTLHFSRPTQPRPRSTSPNHDDDDHTKCEMLAMGLSHDVADAHGQGELAFEARNRHAFVRRRNAGYEVDSHSIRFGSSRHLEVGLNIYRRHKYTHSDIVYALVDFVLESGSGELDGTMNPLTADGQFSEEDDYSVDCNQSRTPERPSFPTIEHRVARGANTLSSSRIYPDFREQTSCRSVGRDTGASRPRTRSWPLRDPEEAYLLKHFADRISIFVSKFSYIKAYSEPNYVTMDDDLLAATVILRLLEEFDVPLAGSDLRGHSFGTKAFIQGPPPSATTTPSLRQAVYWSGLRQEIYNALSLQQAPDVDLSSLHSIFTALGPDAGDCAWANQAIAHCADVLLFSFGTGPRSAAVHEDLRKQNEQWRHSRPASFEPYFVGNDVGAAFPDIRFGSPWHAIGNQYITLAGILLSVHDPSIPTVGPSRRRLVQEADDQIRKGVLTVCGVALSNDSVPPVMVVGCMAIHLCKIIPLPVIDEKES
ncbi:sugar transporter [Penicillium angulare]|uniref:sugar transporter n=1 Tax=Penicillium angulare TaxID=116970 RepID=UPI002540E05D|nr:sugar transporter [Penicillium angulare]KAJ5278598.1 sugar transporter [Penicillium angulare]